MVHQKNSYGGKKKKRREEGTNDKNKMFESNLIGIIKFNPNLNRKIVMKMLN